MAKKIIFCWSGGKDSALALAKIKKEDKYQVASLLTTVTKDYNRISMHGVRKNLLLTQAKSLGLPLEIIEIAKNGSSKQYEQTMKKILRKYSKAGIKKVAFGDIFLEDVRKYREKNLAKAGLKAIFPLWQKSTKHLANQFIKQGFKTIVTCVDTKSLDKNFAGRKFDKKFLNDLPMGVDPGGENGEFHSFVYDGPIFKNKVLFKKGKIVLRNKRFYYCDLIPE